MDTQLREDLENIIEGDVISQYRHPKGFVDRRLPSAKHADPAQKARHKLMRTQQMYKKLQTTGAGQERKLPREDEKQYQGMMRNQRQDVKDTNRKRYSS